MHRPLWQQRKWRIIRAHDWQAGYRSLICFSTSASFLAIVDGILEPFFDAA
ncbi:hypothetical protein ABID08_000052 [Rhizobium binae]|uniref:Uncharacterized protein n=1 Tax=Rhizobium binae TaxID=1138190 RepID=A0ABV2MBE7_9HYPH|nr:hypothetical protein [Rhizobium binae]MBX4991670.1 hypothetical protein [Rhizobium binae]QSY81322.1 hypothetical protein J2J99_16800 [Rhizobium binae]